MASIKVQVGGTWVEVPTLAEARALVAQAAQQLAGDAAGSRDVNYRTAARTGRWERAEVPSKPVGLLVDCPRCGGSGQFLHHGTCFRCNGSGKAYLSQPEVNEVVTGDDLERAAAADITLAGFEEVCLCPRCASVLDKGLCRTCLSNMRVESPATRPYGGLHGWLRSCGVHHTPINSPYARLRFTRAPRYKITAIA